MCDSPGLLRELIEKRNEVSNKARIVAGYCWPWKSKKDNTAMDIVFPELDFAAQWNLTEDGGTWIMRPSSVKQVGCIHTCQGLEVDYVGVILGHDYVVRQGRWVCYPERRAKADMTIRGYGKLLLNDRLAGERQIAEVIRNTYRTLMTRGARGCYVYSVDDETNAYLRASAGRERVVERSVLPVAAQASAPSLPFRILDDAEVTASTNKVRFFPELKAAAGAFLTSSESEQRWAELPETFKGTADLFIVQVNGESMNRKIPNGAWCLFRRRPLGSRNNKIVLVQHVSISDPANGGSYTVKRYRSEKKTADDAWTHDSVTLWPESYDRSFLPIPIPDDAAEEFQVIGELVAVLG